MAEESKKVYLTEEGYKETKDRLDFLRNVERPAVIERTKIAKEQGDLSENAEYHSAREQQSFIEGRIQELEGALSHAQVIDTAALSGDKVLFGATVQLSDADTEEESTYQIVGQYEANLEKGLISLLSPLAKALIGKELGDIVEVNTPRGEKSYEILSVKYI